MTQPRIGAFGEYGGRYIPELLWAALEELSRAHKEIVPGPEFQSAFKHELAVWAGRPTPLTEVPRFAEGSGVRIILKREDLLHGGAHKTNNVVGQGLLAKFLGKKRLIAETGAGQHGVATAMMGARLGMETVVYMGAVDVERQHTNVRRMELCGAKVIPVTSGSATLKDAINEALRDWAESVGNTHYLLGTVCGPDPFPSLVRDFHRVIAREAKEQWAASVGGLPDAILACVGGGSNAMGIFSEFIDIPQVALFGAEPGGEGVETGRHGATLCAGKQGLLHGARTYVMQDPDGQIIESHSISAGLDYPGVGPEHAMLRDSGRARYFPINDDEAIAAFELLSHTEGIVPAFESAHALALAHTAHKRGLVAEGARVLVNLSGRGDKDIPAYLKLGEGRKS